MTEEEWLASTNPERMLEFVLPHGHPMRRFRLFAVACYRFYLPQLRDHRCRKAIEVAELYADRSAKMADLQSMSAFVRDGLYLAGINAVVAETVKAVPCHSAASGALTAAARVPGQKGGVRRTLAATVRDIFGNPFRPVTADPAWLTSTAVAIAQGMYESRDFSAMPILADALQDARCEDVLNHCRDEKATHVRGCWVVDLVLGKE